MFESIYDRIRQRLHIPPGLLVLVIVLVLLYDVGGAVAAVWHMALSMLAAMLGGGDESAIGSVLWRTLPLGLAAAGASFAISNRWLTLDSFHSYIVLAMIVLGGAIIGNACHEKLGSRAVVFANDPLPEDSSAEPREPQPIGLPSERAEMGISISRVPLGKSLAMTPAVGVSGIPAPPTAWQQLSSIRWLEKPDLSRSPQPVEPLKLVPKGPGIYGGVGGAVNQLLGYLVSYEPRLFLASILAGCFVGWRLQRRVAVAQAVVSGDTSELSTREIEQLAR